MSTSSIRSSRLPFHGRLVLAIAATAIVIALAPSASAQSAPRYSFRALPTLGGMYSSAWGINNLGQVVGWASVPGPWDSPQHAVLWDGDVIIDLGASGASHSIANDINDSGQIAGVMHLDFAGSMHATLWDGNAPTDLGALLPGSSAAEGINNAGQVAGHDARSGRAIIWSGGSFTALGSLGSYLSQAFAINDHGHAVGLSYVGDTSIYHPTLWIDGEAIDLGTLGGNWGRANAINNLGQIVGSSTTAGDASSRPTLWSGGTITDLHPMYDARDINDVGQIVGYGGGTAGNHAMLWSEGVVYDLNALIDPQVAAAGWHLQVAQAINDMGWIVGQAYNPSTDQSRAFVLTPIPPPDASPPVITATVTGELGRNGWYRGAVTVAWDVEDEESAVTTTSGCETTSTSADTGGISLTCSATSAGGTSSETITIKIDSTPPTVSCRIAPEVLQPPNRKLVNVSAAVDVVDALSGPSGFSLVSASSSEPDSGSDAADVPNDVQGWTLGTPDVAGQLRAERAGTGSGRIYALAYRGDDAAGNSSTCSAVAIVPHDRRK